MGENAEFDQAASIDTFYLLYCGSLVFFMQAGFGLLEAGTVRSKNLKNILLKNTLDACIGAVVWWAFGFGIAVRFCQPVRSRSHSQRFASAFRDSRKMRLRHAFGSTLTVKISSSASRMGTTARTSSFSWGRFVRICLPPRVG